MPARMVGLLALVAGACVGLGACGDDAPPADGGAPVDGGLRYGCLPHPEPLGAPEDDAGVAPDTWASYARGFFSTWCTRCHASTLGGADRHFAPDGLNWDVEATVRAELPRIRQAVGVTNVMPFTPPRPPCEERVRLVRWIDRGAP